MINDNNKLPESMGKTPLVRIVTFYSRVFKHRYGFSPRVSYPKVGGVFKTLMSELSEQQIALMILLHFEWRGADGSDEYLYKKFSNASFPIEWIPRNSNSYEAYIRNVLHINFDDDNEVFNSIDKKFL